MLLSLRGIIELPDAAGSSFDHGAFDPVTRRVFVAHTGRDRVEVIEHETSSHFATVDGFAEPAGVVTDSARVLVTNRSGSTLSWLDAATLQIRQTYATAPRPNGVAIVAHSNLALVACIGDEDHDPELLSIDLMRGHRWEAKLPGRPRW